MIVFLSTADTDLLAAGRAAESAPEGTPPVILANPVRPGALERAAALVRTRECRVVVLRLLGGLHACTAERRAALDALLDACASTGAHVVAVAGDGQPDAALDAIGTVPAAVRARVDAYLAYGGVENVRALLAYLGAALLGTAHRPPPPVAQPQDGIYHPDRHPDRPAAGPLPASATPDEVLARLASGQPPRRPVIGIVFYRAHWLSGNLAFVDALVRAIERHGCSALPVFCTSLRPETGAGDTRHVLERYFVTPEGRPRIDALVSTLSFAAASLATPADGALEGATEAGGAVAGIVERLGVPVLQALVCTDSREAWAARAAGLGPLDVTMQVALPEFDGRIISVPVCFKEIDSSGVPVYVPDDERCAALAAQAAALARLRHTPRDARRVAIVLGNAPSRNGRIGNAVGLDTPASLVALLIALRDAGYRVGAFPQDGDALIHRLVDAGTYDPEGGLLPPPRGPARWHPPGLLLDNVFVGLQPPRGWGDDPDAVYHDPELPPPPAYVAFYEWLRAAPPEGFGAHAVIHLGKHGTLEWLPGKAAGLSAECAPDRLLGALPLVYPFVVNDPGEGTQAKRRAHAVLVGHLVPPLAPAGAGDGLPDLAAIERLVQDERDARTTDPGKVPLLRRLIAEAATAARLDDDLGVDLAALCSAEASDRRAGAALDALGHYLDDLQRTTIRDGLHVLGRAPAGERRQRLLDALTRLAPEPRRHALRARLGPLLDATVGEIDAVLRALDGAFVPAGPSGSPARGMWNVLPTGRNFYSVDPQAIPSPAAWETGRRLAAALVEKHLAETGAYPRTVGLVVWGTAAMRTHGDDVAEALALLGVRPTWRAENGRVAGVEPVPLAELGRPRIDVTLHISGFFRDAFPHLVALLDQAVEAVARLDESDEANYVAAHVRRDVARLAATGAAPAQARREATFRLFGSKPGCYGAGLLPLIEARNWRTRDDLVRAYETWSAYAYGRDSSGVAARGAFRTRFAAIDVAAKNGDTCEHDLLDSDDYFQYHGGMIATAATLRGEAPRAYFGDSADPTQPVVRSLGEQARRVFRSRVTNPRWLAAMRRHGYKGAFEMAATVDYLFGYDATAGVAADWMYERLAHAYVLDPVQRAFFARSNPWALRDIAERLLEAAARRLWEHPADRTLDALRRAYLEADGDLEARAEPNDARGAVHAGAGAHA